MKKENLKDLRTVRDFLRYAVSRFNAAELSYGHGTDNAHDEAAYLILETLHLPLDRLDPYMDAVLLASEKKALTAIIEKRVKTRKPAAYLTNKGYLKGLQFYVDERVIVPRSYIGDILTSGLVGGDEDTIIDNPGAIETVLDLCTGSGCLAILAAHIFPFADVDAVDLSKDALEVAKINVKKHGCEERVSLHRGDLFKPLKGKQYDLIITNPPYVHSELMKSLPPEHRKEPKMALESGNDGLDITRRILAEAADYLTEDGVLICEIGEGFAILDEEYPEIQFNWIDSENNDGEVFWLIRDQLLALR